MFIQFNDIKTKFKIFLCLKLVNCIKNDKHCWPGTIIVEIRLKVCSGQNILKFCANQ